MSDYQKTYSKAERHELMRLAPLVHEAEMHQSLQKLDKEFMRWREGMLGSADLNEIIHEFHQKDSRELWSTYQRLKRHEVVIRGVVLGFLQREQLSASLYAKLEEKINVYLWMRSPDAWQPAEPDDDDDDEWDGTERTPSVLPVPAPNQR